VIITTFARLTKKKKKKKKGLASGCCNRNQRV
jgi:ribosome assembly protein YihI (activator of Der GTPase)